MASLPTPAIAAAVAVLLTLTIPCNSATPATKNCTSEAFSNNKTFSSCADLPQLKASLFWTYNPTNSTATIAFVAPPPKPTGWIAWAINPTSTGMVGSQALIAFQSNGSMKVDTYNISSYGPVHPSPISIKTSNLEAEFEGGLMRIFATVELPKNETTLNQVWQVGSSVNDGSPDKHAFGKENLDAKGVLDLLKGESVAKSGAPRESRKGNSTGNSGAGGATPAVSSPSASPPALSGSFWKGLVVLVLSFGFFIERLTQFL